jgi:hypothetical protein
MSLTPFDAHADDRGQQGSPDLPGDPVPAVFVDSTGRRALLLRRAGIVFSAAVLVYAAMVGVAFVGGPSLAPAQLSPFGGAGSAQEPDGEGARPAGSPSAGQSARPCGKHCGKKCRNHRGNRQQQGSRKPQGNGQQQNNGQHQGSRRHPGNGKHCARKPFQKTLDSPSGAPLSRSSRSSAEGR